MESPAYIYKYKYINIERANEINRKRYVPLPKFNSLPLKMGWLEDELFLLGPGNR